MNFNEYQEIAKTTAVFTTIGEPFVYPALGLAGETGEVLEKIKKSFRDGVVRDAEWTKSVGKELGDVLWYLAILADQLGLTLQEVVDLNIEKIKSREAKGTLHGNGDDR